MPQTADTNRRVVLAERPNGVPDAKTLQLQKKQCRNPGLARCSCARVTYRLTPICAGA